MSKRVKRLERLHDFRHVPATNAGKWLYGQLHGEWVGRNKFSEHMSPLLWEQRIADIEAEAQEAERTFIRQMLDHAPKGMTPKQIIAAMRFPRRPIES